MNPDTTAARRQPRLYRFWPVPRRPRGRCASRALLLAAIALALLPAQQAAADSLGRLFTTPQQRRQLDEIRRAQALAPEAVPKFQVTGDGPDLPQAPANPLTVRGIVMRGKGPSAAWINDSNTLEGDLSSEYLQLRPGDIAGDSVRLRASGEGEPIPVKVGQTLEPASGRVLDPAGREAASGTRVEAGSERLPPGEGRSQRRP